MINFATFEAVSFVLAGSLWLTMTVAFVRWFLGSINIKGRPLRR